MQQWQRKCIVCRSYAAFSIESVFPLGAIAMMQRIGRRYGVNSLLQVGRYRFIMCCIFLLELFDF